MTELLTAEKLNQSYNEALILSDIDLAIHSGEFLAIMGQSGSGKSTLLYLLSGMDRPTAGRVVFNGRELSTLNDREMSRIRLNDMGFIFQSAGLINSLNVRDNIVLPGLKAASSKRKEVLLRADEWMKKTAITNIANRDIAKISGGELQRAAVCRALINEPEIIFADEPTGALNRAATIDVMDILNRIHDDGRTIVIVTHDAKVAARAERVLFLSDGRIKSELSLGRYHDDMEVRNEREKKMSDWLEEQGF
jgi:putative ABC transport system ATP-binding protein